MLYRLKLKTGESAIVYILLEHKSYPDKFVAFQLARYILKIWEQSPLDKNQKLPLIFPLVLYHGKSRWNYKKELIDLVEKTNSALWRKHTLNFEYFVCDISQIPAEEIKGVAMLQAALSLMKYIQKPNELLPRLVGIFELLFLMPRQNVLQFLSKVIKYLSVSSKIITTSEIDKAMNTAIKQKKKRVDLYEEFIQRWKSEGLEVGKKEGIQEGEKNLLFRQITKRFGKISKQVSSQIENLSIANLETLGEKLFDFSTMSDVENWLKENSELFVSRL